MTYLNSILKSKHITLPTKVPIVKAIVFPVVMYRYESWIIKKDEHRRTDTFELWYWRRLFQFSRSLVSNSLQPHELQYARPPCPSPTPELAQTHFRQVSDAIQPSVPLRSPSLSCAQSFPASESFPMSHFFTSDGQSIGASASTSVPPVNIQG